MFQAKTFDIFFARQLKKAAFQFSHNPNWWIDKIHSAITEHDEYFHFTKNVGQNEVQIAWQLQQNVSRHSIFRKKFKCFERRSSVSVLFYQSKARVDTQTKKAHHTFSYRESIKKCFSYNFRRRKLYDKHFFYHFFQRKSQTGFKLQIGFKPKLILHFKQYKLAAVLVKFGFKKNWTKSFYI